MPAPDPGDVDLILELARQAGALALDYVGVDVEIREKDRGEPVSEADLAVNELILGRLARARPEDGILSEESEDDGARLSKRRVWVIDPIDGTRAFLKGKPDYAVAIALVEDGQVILGAVHAPSLGRLYWAGLGLGAFVDDTAIRVTTTSAIEDCLILAGKNLFKHPQWPKPWPPMRIDNPPSLALKLCRVAEGVADAVMTLSPVRDWDIAAASVILTEAGGRLADHRGGAFAFNQDKPVQRSLVGANPALAEALLARTQALKF